MSSAGRSYRGGSSGVSSSNLRNQRGAYSGSGAGRSSNDFEYAGRRGQDRFDADVLPSESASQASDSDNDEEGEDYDEYNPDGQYQQAQTMYQQRDHQYQQPAPPQRRQTRPQPQSYHERKTMHDRMHQMQDRLKRSETAQGILDFLGGPLRSRYRHNRRARGNHYYDGPASLERKKAAHQVALAQAAQKQEAKQRRAEKLEIRRARAEAEAQRREAATAAMQVPELPRQQKHPRRPPQDMRSEVTSSSQNSSRMGSEQLYQEDSMSSTVSSASGLRPGMRPNKQDMYLQPQLPPVRRPQRAAAKYDPKLGRYVGGSGVGSAVSGLYQTSSALGFKDPSLRYDGSSMAGSSRMGRSGVGSATSGSSSGSHLMPPRRGPGEPSRADFSQASSIPAPVRQYGAERMHTSRRGPPSAPRRPNEGSSVSGNSQGFAAPSSASSRSAPVPASLQMMLAPSDARSQSSHGGKTPSNRSASKRPPPNQPANTFEYLRNNVDKIAGYGERHMAEWLDSQEDLRERQKGPYKPRKAGASISSSAVSGRSGATLKR